MEPATPNPYESPAVCTRSPRLAYYERETLKAYLKFHEKPPTVWRWLQPHAAQWLRFAFILTALAAVAWIFLEPDAVLVGAMLGIAFLLGIAARDYSYARLVIAIWPMLDDMFDWDRVRARYDEMSK